VEHAYTHREPATPWRTAAIVAAAVAAVELFILVLVGVAFGAKLVGEKAETIVAQTIAKQTETPPPAASEETTTKQKPKKTAPVAELPRSRTSVIVLNGNGIPAAAAVAAEQVRKFEYIIAATGNAPRTDFQRSVVMFRPGYEGEARRLAKDLKIRRATPLDGMGPRDLQGAHIAYIVGA
jgi:LytR cell envelope-related transcriptional attenuator